MLPHSITRLPLTMKDHSFQWLIIPIKNIRKIGHYPLKGQKPKSTYWISKWLLDSSCNHIQGAIFLEPFLLHVYTNTLRNSKLSNGTYIIYKTPTKLVELFLFLSKQKFHHFSLLFCWNILPEIAATSAAVKLGSFVNEEAICSTKNFWASGVSVLGFELLSSMLDLGFVRSRVMVGPDEAREAVQGTEPSVRLRFEPGVASIEGCGWLCSPS